MLKKWTKAAALCLALGVAAPSVASAHTYYDRYHHRYVHSYDHHRYSSYDRRHTRNCRTGGTVRAATLVATGEPGTLQIRLVDPATKGERAGLGACTGDSGAPAFRDLGGALAVIGVVSWSTGPNLSDGCGGLTGVTPLARYRGWIVEQAGKMGSPLQ